MKRPEKIYHNLFNELSAPNTKNKDEYKSSKIPNTNHRIGKNFEELPSILIKTKDQESIVSNYKGANILLRFNVTEVLTLSNNLENLFFLLLFNNVSSNSSPSTWCPIKS